MQTRSVYRFKTIQQTVLKRDGRRYSKSNYQRKVTNERTETQTEGTENDPFSY